MSKSIFDLFGIDLDAVNKLSDISLKDYIKTNDNIKGAFNELSDEKKKKVVESMNKIQNTFADLFGTKAEVFTEDDFKDSNVVVSTKVYDTKDSEDNKDENEDVFVEAPDGEDESFNESRECEEDDTTDTFDRYECRGCENYEDCLNEYKDAVCESHEDCSGCEFKDECTDDNYERQSICDELLEELEDESTCDEEVVDSIVEYVLATIGEKKNKKYILHPGTNTVPPAVEVKIPTEVATSEIFDNVHIMTMLRDMLIDSTGAHDAYINQGESNSVVVYIPLKRK